MGSKKKGNKTLSKADMKKRVEEIKAVASSPVTSTSSNSPVATSPRVIEVPHCDTPMTQDVSNYSEALNTSINNSDTRMLNAPVKIPTVSWSDVTTGNIPSKPTDTRLVRPLFFLTNKILSKLILLAQKEIPEFETFGLDIVGTQFDNPEGKIKSFRGESLSELDAAIECSNGHFIALAPIYGGGKGQRTEAEVISIIESTMTSKNFKSITVVTIGNRGADYLTFPEYEQYQSVLNYSLVTKTLQLSEFYRVNLVGKETEQLLSRDGAASFPLNFHFLFRQQTSNKSGYIISSNTRTPEYQRLNSSRTLSQLVPGSERFSAIGGTWKTLNTFGQDLIRKGTTVYKTQTSSGDTQLIVDHDKVNLKPNQALDLGMWIIPVNEFHLKDGETIVGVQQKGSTIPMMIKCPAIKKYARFIQPSGGCRISVILPSDSVQEFAREAMTAGMHVFSTTGRVFPFRSNLNDAGYLTLPATNGDIEIPSIPIAINKEEIVSKLRELTHEVDWVAARGSSPFNYSLLGITKNHTKSMIQSLSESIREVIQQFDLCDVWT